MLEPDGAAAERDAALDGLPAVPAWWWAVLRRLLHSRGAVLGLVVVSVLGTMALLAPWIDRHDVALQDYSVENQGPSARFWLGTDDSGRDQYSRLLHGARVSLTVAVFSQALGLSLGLAVGMAAGLGGRRADNVLMRLTDIGYAFPDLLMLILVVSVFGPSVPLLVLAIGLVSWATIARLVRGQVLSLREEEFVLAARSLGAGSGRIALRHMLPNVLGPVIVTATFGIPAAIFAEAALGFLGLGLQIPAPSWGRIVFEAFDVHAPERAAIPCAVVALTMLSFTLIGDGLRDALDPRSSRRRALPRAEPERPAAAVEEERAA